MQTFCQSAMAAGFKTPLPPYYPVNLYVYLFYFFYFGSHSRHNVRPKPRIERPRGFKFLNPAEPDYPNRLFSILFSLATQIRSLEPESADAFALTINN